jgi:LAGLIDADG-like domain
MRRTINSSHKTSASTVNPKLQRQILVVEDPSSYDPLAKTNDLTKYADDPMGFFRDVLKLKHITKEQEQIALSVRDNHDTNVVAGHAVGKCVDQDEYITLADGLEVQAKTCVGKWYKIPTLDAKGNVVIADAYSEWNAIEDVYQVITESGKLIIRNGQHPLYAAIKWSIAAGNPILDVKHWTTIEKIQHLISQPDQYVYGANQRRDRQGMPLDERYTHSLVCAMPDTLPIFGNYQIEDYKVKFLAYMIGDGGTTAVSAPRFTQEDNKQLAEMREIVDLFECELNYSSQYDYRIVRKIKTTWNTEGYEKSRAVAFLIDSGVAGKKAIHKVIPDFVFSLSREQLALFLSRLFSTDGWACISNPLATDGRQHKPRPQIGYCSSSEEMIYQVQRLLLRFGVQSSVYSKPNVNSWHLLITTPIDIITYIENIGIYGKEEAIERVRACVKAKLTGNRHSKWRSKKAPLGTHWERVLSISKLTEKRQTVAITVPEYGTYLTAFYEHNTACASWIILWWVCAVRGECMSTAPTNNLLEKALWNEVNKTHGRNKLALGGICLTRKFTLTAEAHAYGFTVKDYDADAMQGLHAPKLLAIEDEASGITENVDNGLSSCVSALNNRMLRIGNPVSITTPFYNNCKVTNIKIPVFTHPNVNWAYDVYDDPEKGVIADLKPHIKEALYDGDKLKEIKDWPYNYRQEVIPGAVSIFYIEDKRIKHGTDSVEWKTRILAEFTDSNVQSIVSKQLFEQARANYDNNKAHWDNVARTARWRHGLDPADGGDDHGLASWCGPVLYYVNPIPSIGDERDVLRIADRAKSVLTARPGVLGVDNIGVGAGTLAELKRTGYNAVSVKVNRSPSSDKAAEEFYNLKAELFWKFREGLRLGKYVIAPLYEYENYLMEELTHISYKTKESRTNSVIEITPKEEVRKSLGRSPNIADAAIIALFIGSSDMSDILARL